IAKTTIIIATSISMLGSAQAGGMQIAKGHTEKAIVALQEKATSDKGGHRIAAIKLLKEALAEIDKGVAFDQANDTKGERKKKKN
ncbi:MAG: hypothetical protein ACOYMN_10580, partial [Roseimicrobium sp.]